MDHNGISWMIAGGTRAVSRDEQHQQRHRADLASASPTEPRAWGAPTIAGLRQRFARFAGSPKAGHPATATFAGDCCPA